MAETAATLTRLLLIREIQKDGNGATLHFQQEGQGRLAHGDVNYETHLRLARRGQERQHPVGVRFGAGQTIAELSRADNDVPTELSTEESAGTRVLFQGHDGVFCLKADHPDYVRLRSVLAEATQRKARIWFFAQKPELALLDLLPTEWGAAASHPCDGNKSLPAAKHA